MLKEITRKLFESERGTSFSLLHLPVNKRALANGMRAPKGTQGEATWTLYMGGWQSGREDRSSLMVGGGKYTASRTYQCAPTVQK